MSASDFFVDSFFWITLIATVVVLANYAFVNLFKFDFLDSALKMVFKDTEKSQEHLRQTWIGGLALMSAISMFWAGVTKQNHS